MLLSSEAWPTPRPGGALGVSGVAGEAGSLALGAVPRSAARRDGEMELWSRMSGFLLGLIDQYDDQAIFLLMFLEETGVPLPTPGDLVMLLGGYRVARGQMDLLWVLFLIQLATCLGASVLYWLAARGGRPLLYRYGRYIHMDRARLDRAEAAIARRAFVAIFLGRIIPGLRTPTVVAAGVFGVPYWQFLLAFTPASFIYIVFWVLLGVWAGPYAVEVLTIPELSVRAVLTALTFVALALFLAVMYRRAWPVRRLPRETAPEGRRLETSALAGFVATLIMGLGVNVALYALSALDARLPEQTLLRFVEGAGSRVGDFNGLRSAVTLIALVTLGSAVWAVLYTHVAVPLWAGPGWLRGLMFSVAPLSFSSLVLLPLLGAGPLGLHLEAGLLPFAGEAFRNVLFGVGLGVSHSLLWIARQRPARIIPTIEQLDEGDATIGDATIGPSGGTQGESTGGGGSLASV